MGSETCLTCGQPIGQREWNERDETSNGTRHVFANDCIRALRAALSRTEGAPFDYDAEAAGFYRATGIMPPGKDVAAAVGEVHSRDVREAAWRAWRAARLGLGFPAPPPGSGGEPAHDRALCDNTPACTCPCSMCEWQRNPAPPAPEVRVCRRCGGDGGILTHEGDRDCPACGGTGRLQFCCPSHAAAGSNAGTVEEWRNRSTSSPSVDEAGSRPSCPPTVPVSSGPTQPAAPGAPKGGTSGTRCACGRVDLSLPHVSALHGREGCVTPGDGAGSSPAPGTDHDSKLCLLGETCTCPCRECVEYRAQERRTT